MHTKLNKIKSAILSGMIAAVSVAGSITPAAPSLNATAAGNDNYARLLQYSLYFYDSNMCGSKVSSTSKLSWRGNCHTNDEVDGGYHDAGDHVMFGLPQGYTASTLGWAYYEFKDAFTATGQAGHFKTVSDYFCTFFKNATVLNGNSVSKICIEKGNGDIDHAYWGPPETQGDRGGCLWASNGSGDIAAEYAAALAASYVNFGNTEDLTYAKALYNYAKSNTGATNRAPYYNSEGSDDDIAWAAGWLYLATKDEGYKNDLVSGSKWIGWTHCWNNVTLGAAILKAEVTNDWSEVKGWIGNKYSGSGYFFQDEWGSARYNCAAQMACLVAEKRGAGSYSGWAKNQMNYILGDNPANTCFVVGFANNSAKKPHHRACSGTSTAESDGQDSKYTLVGALVGGPTDAGGTYKDLRSDYKCNEVAIDYNAGLVGAAAGLYSIFKTGTVDSTIVGVSDAGSTPVDTTPSQPQQTTAPYVQPVERTTAPTNPGTPSSNGDYIEYKANQRIVYKELPEDDKMIGWSWKDLGVKASDKISKVEICISSNNGNIGKWQGAFGSSTKISPDYWTQTKDMQETISGNSGVITWEIPSSTAADIQTEYGGELKWGIWWVDCGDITVDSIKVYTGSGSSSTVRTTEKTTPKTTAPSVVRTTTPSNPSTPSSNGDYIEYKANQRIVYKELPEDDKMIGWSWKDLGVTSKDKISKVEICISSNNGNIGKWQGAFGSSTKISPDYWTQTKDMQETISGNSGVITWEIPSSTAADIQTEYGGELKWGIWWVDCGDITVDSIKVYTGSGSSTVKTTEKTTQKTTERTTERTTEKATQPVTDRPQNDTKVTKWGDANCDGKVSLGDSLAILQFIVNSDKYPMTAQGQANADVSNNGDGLTSMDSFVIQQVVTDLITENDLPVSYMKK